ncbi:hypothetical protein AWZ03_014993, partial [Drosophila navojoa]
MLITGPDDEHDNEDVVGHGQRVSKENCMQLRVMGLQQEQQQQQQQQQ